MEPQHKPANYSTASPYLIVDGAAGTIDFLKRVLDGVEVRRITDASGRVRHAEVRIEDTVVMMSDPFPPDWAPVGSHVHVYVPDVDATYRKAIGAGAVSVLEPVQQDEDKRGGVMDAGGTTWWIATNVESPALDVPPAPGP